VMHLVGADAPSCKILLCILVPHYNDRATTLHISTTVLSFLALLLCTAADL